MRWCALVAALMFPITLPAQIFPDDQGYDATRKRVLEERSRNPSGNNPTPPPAENSSVTQPPSSETPVVGQTTGEEEAHRKKIKAAFDAAVKNIDDERKLILRSEEIQGYADKLDPETAGYFHAQLQLATADYRKALKSLKDLTFPQERLEPKFLDEHVQLIHHLQSGEGWLRYFQAEILNLLDITAGSADAAQEDIKKARRAHERKAIDRLTKLVSEAPYNDDRNLADTQKRKDEFTDWLTSLEENWPKLCEYYAAMAEEPWDIDKANGFFMYYRSAIKNKNQIPIAPLYIRRLLQFYLSTFLDIEDPILCEALILQAETYALTCEFDKAAEALNSAPDDFAHELRRKIEAAKRMISGDGGLGKGAKSARGRFERAYLQSDDPDKSFPPNGK